MPEATLGDVKALYPTLVAALQSSLEAEGSPVLTHGAAVWTAQNATGPALLHFDPQDLLVITPRGPSKFVGHRVRYTRIAALPQCDAVLRLSIDNAAQLDLRFATNADAGRVAEQLIRKGAAGPNNHIEVEEPRPVAATKILLVTTDAVAGHDIAEVHGDVFGISMAVTNNDILDTVLAVGSYLSTSLSHESYSRNTHHAARQQLVNNAVARGGSAVVSMRYTSTVFGHSKYEVVAYGTAVTLRKHPSLG